MEFFKALLRRLQDHDRLGFSCRLNLHGYETSVSQGAFLRAKAYSSGVAEAMQRTSPLKKRLLEQQCNLKCATGWPGSKKCVQFIKEENRTGSGNIDFGRQGLEKFF